MNRGKIKKPFKTVIYTACGICLLQFATTSYAVLSAETLKAIQGEKPRLASNIEDHLDDFELFGLSYDNKSFYGNDLIDMPVPVSYPFRDRFTIAPIKQPNSDQFLDVDGDELDALNIKDQATMTWFYTNAKNELVEFKPSATDTFCALAQKGMLGPYKVRISADLTLFSKYGDPYTNEYPNEKVITHPTKLYTVLEDVGICYVRPELKPTEAKNSALNQWDPKLGFLIQSNVDATKNFPTTGFYGAKFDLLLSRDGLVNDYDWDIIEGNELVTLSKDSNVVTVLFNTSDALSTQAAWQHVVGSDGYKVVIQGKNKSTNNKIQYAFVITKWFADWDKNVIGLPMASKSTAQKVEAGCKTLDGKYRLSYANEVSNAPMGNSSGSARFTREIGTALGEWGDPNQIAYPNSWAAGPKQDNQFKRIWLWDLVENKHCDLHPYNAKYHCRSEAEPKSGLCTAEK